MAKVNFLVKYALCIAFHVTRITKNKVNGT